MRQAVIDNEISETTMTMIKTGRTIVRHEDRMLSGRSAYYKVALKPLVVHLNRQRSRRKSK